MLIPGAVDEALDRRGATGESFIPHSLLDGLTEGGRGGEDPHPFPKPCSVTPRLQVVQHRSYCLRTWILKT